MCEQGSSGARGGRGLAGCVEGANVEASVSLISVKLGVSYIGWQRTSMGIQGLVGWEFIS